MIIGNKTNGAELVTLVPSIKNHMHEWHIIKFLLRPSFDMSLESFMDTILQQYKYNEGIIYQAGHRKFICLMRLGDIADYTEIKKTFEQHIPEHTSRITMQKMTAVGLKQIQIDFLKKKAGSSVTDMFSAREKRKQNVIMLADDDLFIRKTMVKILAPFGTVIQVERGDDVLPSYIEHNPDILLLDIHMPGRDGLSTADQILRLDPDAYIIFLSADSVKENVLTAMEKGAAGFLGKPPKKDKVVDYLHQCITFQ